MAPRTEVLVFGCSEDDLRVLRSAAEEAGSTLRTVTSLVKVAQHAAARHPCAIVLGVGRETLGNLDVIPLVRTVRADLPVIVIAEEESLELERKAREKGIFYYLLHPIEKEESAAVLEDLTRRASRWPG